LIVADTIPANLIVASHLTGIYDVNRNITLADDDFSLVAAWAHSIADAGLHGILFHNNFSETTCTLHQNERIHFVKVEYNPAFNPNVFRYCIYSEFLKQYAAKIDNIFFTDVSDVTVVNNPFLQELYLQNPTAIFCGDENEQLENEWMLEHAAHLRNNIPGYAAYEAACKYQTLLNCGIIGGRTTVMQEFMLQLWNLHATYNTDNKTAYTGDMGAFNYLARTTYNQQLIHGHPVNTVFKSYTTDRSCWFQHK
jgi:hypothetical protein